jgi:hypothetical protein
VRGGAEAVANVGRGNGPSEQRGANERRGELWVLRRSGEEKKHGAARVRNFDRWWARFPFKGGRWDTTEEAEGVGRRVEGGTGEREGARERRGMAQVAGIGPRPAGVGSDVAARQWREAGCG